MGVGRVQARALIAKRQTQFNNYVEALPEPDVDQTP